MFISRDDHYKSHYNDLDIVMNPDVYRQLAAQGLDQQLCRHYAHLWVRDPLVVYKNSVELDDSKRMDHFENIQSTNWQSMRFKPPPLNSEIGWRVELRSMELQFSDFENAAFSIFSVLITRVLANFDVNLYIPLSKVDENMQRAQQRDACRAQKFWFRRHITRGEVQNDALEEMSVARIINGGDQFVGLIPLIRIYLDTVIGITEQELSRIGRYLDFISLRAAGKLLTNAQWIRQQVLAHPAYKHDSVVSRQILSDVYRSVIEISEGRLVPQELYGNISIALH